MSCLLLLLISMAVLCIESTNVGTTLFYNKRDKSDCWYEEDVGKLRARKMFQATMPAEATPFQTDSRFIRNAIRYFNRAMRTTENYPDRRISAILKEALADALGGHLRYQMLPTARFAYYAGYVPYRHVRELHDYLNKIKGYLNTKGMGWRAPSRIPQWSNLTVVKVLIGSGKLFDPCAYLITKRDSNSCIHLPPPKVDDTSEPNAIALPFKAGGLVSLTSARSENILLKYYTTAARCILRNSPDQCRHSDFVNFNNELWHWMKRDVAPRLLDEKLYVAYGGVLRIAAAVQSYGKGLSRRNLFEYQDAGVSKWHPWQALTQSYVYINADWTPKLYVGMVLLAAMAICLLQICYNYIFGDPKGCHCKGRSKSSFSKEVAYTTMDTAFPPMAGTHSGDDTPNKHSGGKTLSSLQSAKTQKVYDLNENTEKLMEVILSGKEYSEAVSGSKREESDANSAINLGQSSRNPPELPTPMAQHRIDTRSERNSSKMFTTSTETSEMTCCQASASTDSSCSGTGSSSASEQSASHSSKTRRKSRTERDIAWARRVASKHTLHTNTRSTDFDVTSYSTPPSRR